MSTQHINLQIDGMTCQACASRIEKVLNKKTFITAASVNFASEEAQITYDDSQTDPAALLEPGRTRLPATTWATHGEDFVAAIENGPLSATQFHPEKSGDAGAQLLRNWLSTL